MSRDNRAELSAGPAEGLPPWTIATTAQRILAVDFSTEELINLRQGAAAALRVRPVIRHVKTGAIIPTWAYGRLSDTDMEAIDHATLEFAQRLRPAGGQLPLILPQSFRTATSRRGRGNLNLATNGDPKTLKSQIIIELTEVDRGTPSGRLGEVCNLLGSACKGVFVRLQPGRDAITPIREVRAQGLSLDAGDIPGTDSYVASTLLEIGELAQGRAPLLVAQGLTSDGFFAVAEVAGFTHVSLKCEASAP
ncbi:MULTISPECIES: hypothetical protein [Phenylobacterium]|uniref:Uncharacterized protein n=1 Tax=Phenylobacterium koreense TaxID=266125 RepID=A0ABV2EN86_9CAUL